MVDFKQIGANLKKMRIELNMTQEELADVLKMTQPEISNLENGKYGSGIDNLSKLDFISKTLNMDIRELCFGGSTMEKINDKQMTEQYVMEYMLKHIIVYSPIMIKSIREETSHNHEELLDEPVIKSFLPLDKWDSIDVDVISKAVNSENESVRDMAVFCIYFSIINYCKKHNIQIQSTDSTFELSLFEQIYNHLKPFPKNKEQYRRWTLIILYDTIHYMNCLYS